MQMLGIDLGTSYIKGAVLDLPAHTIQHVTRRPFPSPPANLPPLHHEVEPEAVIEATRDLIHALLARAPDCRGILISSQMHGVILSDQSGVPLTRMITWQDQRALAPLIHRASSSAAPPTAVSELQTHLDEQTLLQLGNGFKTSLPLCALYTLLRRQQLTAGAVVWSLADFVFAHLSGAIHNNAAEISCMEPTIAASMGAYDFGRHDWHTDLLQRLGLNELIWPRIVAAETPAYSLATPGGNLPVYPSLGDHQCATLGSLLRPDELALNISTGSQVSLLHEKWAAASAYETRPYFGGRYLNTVTRVPAGRALSALVNLLTEIPRRQQVSLADPWQTIVQAIEEVPESDLHVNLSLFSSPFGETGSISHMTEANLTVGHLFQAAFQHMARNYAQCAAWLGWDPPLDGSTRRLVFAGGLAQRFAPLRAAVATELHAGYRLSPHPEDTFLGLLTLGLVISGSVPTLDEALAVVADSYSLSGKI